MTTKPTPFVATRRLLSKPSFQRAITVLFFLLTLILALNVVSDYGVSVDESYEAHTARINYDYLTGQSDKLLSYDDRHYGAILPLLMQYISNFFTDSRADLLARHTLTYLIFFLSGFFLYAIIRKLKFNRYYAILGVALYYFHPHLFSHSFYNLKDIPFTALFTANLFTLQLLLEKQTKRVALLHGVFTGLLIVIRVPGVVIGASTVILGLYLLLLQPKRWRALLSIALVYAIASAATLFAFMPSLWHAPIEELRVFLSMDLFSWPYKEIFMGELIPGYSIPRIYIPVYFAVTTPLLYLAFGVIGTFAQLYHLFIKRSILDPKRAALSLPFFGFYFPVLVIMITRPIIYNGWRHAFFIYPAFVIFVLIGVKAVLNLIASIPSRSWKNSAIAVLLLLAGAQTVEQVRFFIISHPYEHVYYNRLAGEDLSAARRLYAMDYWGLSYKEALDAILAMDDRDQIRVLGYHPLLVEQNKRILPPEDRDRIIVAQKDEDYDYFIQHFRNDFTEVFPNRELVYQIRVDGALINAVYKYIP